MKGSRRLVGLLNSVDTSNLYDHVSDKKTMQTKCYFTKNVDKKEKKKGKLFIFIQLQSFYINSSSVFHDNLCILLPRPVYGSTQPRIREVHMKQSKTNTESIRPFEVVQQ